MQFTSFAYLAFLPLVLLAYHLLRRRVLQNGLLLCASYVFYGWWDYRFCMLMLASSLVDYFVGSRLHQTENVRERKIWLSVSICSNLGLLGVFKYFNFFIDSFREVGEVFGFNMSGGTLEIILPVGISFYTFQTMSYTIDIYRRQLEPSSSLVDYLAFVSFFPQLVAGPIERASRLLPQLQRSRTVTWEDTASGARQILCGFFKKIVIADSVAVFVGEAYATPETMSGARLTLATMLFAFQIYCDFSAYSDIAIGTARMFGIELMQNFNYPYFSKSMGEFWQRWHISLSTWFRDYVYIPLGGNRGGSNQTRRNLFVTFLVSGLWHGAAWKFVGWGAFHGSALMAERRPARKDLPKPVNWFSTFAGIGKMAATFVIVCLGWVLFRADSLSDALLIWWKMATSVVSPEQWLPIWSDYLARGPLFFTLNLLVVFVAIEWVHRKYPFPLAIGHWPSQARWPVYTLAVWLVIEFADKTPQSPFIYFQF